jgi:hypothetical protein
MGHFLRAGRTEGADGDRRDYPLKMSFARLRSFRAMRNYDVSRMEDNGPR